MIIYEGLLCRYRTVHTFYSVLLSIILSIYKRKSAGHCGPGAF